MVGVAAALDGDRILRRTGFLRLLRRSRRFGAGLRAGFDVAGMCAADGVNHKGRIGSATKDFNDFFVGGEDEGYFDNPRVAGPTPAMASRHVAQW